MKNKQEGFIELIIVVIIALILMRYYGITFTGVWYWLRDLFLSVW